MAWLVRAQILGVALAVAWAPADAGATPRTPTNDDEVVARLPQGLGDGASGVARLRAAVRARPTDPEATADLAQAYMDLAMSRGDPRYVGYAQAVLRPAAAQAHAHWHTQQAVVAQYSHDFDTAGQHLTQALRLDPDHASAYAWRAAIALVQAHYDDARADCQHLTRLGRQVMALGCAGLLAAYTGDLARAQGLLNQALAVSTDADERLWLLTRQGEVASWAAQPARAEQAYTLAMALGLDDPYLLAAWADWALDRGQAAAVAQRLQNWQAADPLLLRLALAHAALGSPQAAALRDALAQRFDAARQRGDRTHQAEEARFALVLLNDPARALALAQANYAVQKEPRDARVLLEAALAARRPDAAAPVLAWLKDSRFADPRLRALADQLPSGGRP